MLAHDTQIAEVLTYEDLVGASDPRLSIVVPESALGTAQLVADAIRSSAQQTIYVDCNAIAPGTVKAAAEVITAAGSRFIDAGIIDRPEPQDSPGSRGRLSFRRRNAVREGNAGESRPGAHAGTGH